MQCTIMTADELKKKRRADRERLMVVPRWKGMPVLERDEINAVYRLPQGVKQKGESEEEAVRRILGTALGEAAFEVRSLCGYTVLEADGKERGGMAYTADVQEWPDERASHALPFSRMPLGSQMSEPALLMGLYRWAGEFFDERLELERLGSPAQM